MDKFSRKTFQYFDQAYENRNKLKWFDQNKALYEDHVVQPFSYMINLMDLKFGERLDKIAINPKNITRPKNAKNRAQNGLIKDFTKIDLCEKRTSLFEWNPGFHIRFGSKNSECYFAGGLYMVSGRQMREYRSAIENEHLTIRKLIKNKKFKSSWGEIESERYKRFPKEYDESEPFADFLWMKQFYFAKSPTRSEMVKKDFIGKIVDDFENSIDVLNWIRKAVGVYEK